MNKVVKRILTVFIILLVIFLVAWPKLAPLSKSSTDAKPAGVNGGSASIPVKGTIIKPQQLDDKITITGAVLANEALDLRTEISGIISKIYFKEGDNVKKGQVLLSVNVDNLRAQLEKLKYTQQLSEEIEGRQKKLLEREAISQEEYDISLTEFRTSAADIKVLQEQISKSVIRSPFEGSIGLRYVSEGSYITPETKIAYLVKVNPAKIEFSVPGRYTSKVANGDRINFTVEGIDEVFQGAVYAKEPVIDAVTRTLKIRALSGNDDKKLVPGQFVRIELVLNSMDSALLVPTQSVVPDVDGHIVYKKTGDKAEAVRVEIGIRRESEVQIMKGIQEKDTILITGIQQVEDGSTINITEIN